MSKTLQAESLQAETLQAEASTKDKIKNALNAYTPLLRNNFKETFVTLQSGKSLSTNDFTNDFKAKLTSIESGAQVNKLEKILLNGTNISIGADKSANISISGSDNNFTDAYKNKLDSIESGAQVNKLNGIVFSGAEYDFDTATKVAKVTITGGNNFVINNHTVKSASITGADFDFNTETKTANITVSGGLENFTVNGAAVTAMSVTGAASVTTADNSATINVTGADKFTLNGAEIKSASIVGADVSIDSGHADITITGGSGGGGIDAVSVVSGAMTASIDGDTLYLQSADKTPKLDAGFNLAGSSSLFVDKAATITASRQGNGIITPIPNDNFTITQLNATQFEVTPTIHGAQNLGFFLNETAEYYGAAENFAVDVGTTTVVLMHFNDTAHPYKNEGTADTIGSGGAATISSAYGKFGSGFYSPNANLLPQNIVEGAAVPVSIGGADYTIDFWYKYTGSTVPRSTVLFQFQIRYNDNGCDIGTLSTYSGNEPYAFHYKGVSTYIRDLPNINTQMNHYAICYKYAEKEIYFFYNGELVIMVPEVEIERGYFAQARLANCNIDELRILNGVAAWTDNFTPPTAPY